MTSLNIATKEANESLNEEIKKLSHQVHNHLKSMLGGVVYTHYISFNHSYYSSHLCLLNIAILHC